MQSTLAPRSSGKRARPGLPARAASLLLFSLLLLSPLRAMALLLPICETEAPVTRMPDPSCELVTAVDDETGKTSVAPICDPRGLSAIAPPRILPVADARIEASRPCGHDDGTPLLGPRPDDSGSPVAAHVTLAATIPLEPPGSAPRAEAALIDWREPAGGPRAGVSRDVYHPPR
jgi:hypothetical protein